MCDMDCHMCAVRVQLLRQREARADERAAAVKAAGKVRPCDWPHCTCHL